MGTLTGALQAALSGLSDASSKTEVIGGNIANTDTSGYKQYEALSQNLVNSSSGNSAGVTSVRRQLIDQQGAFTRTDIGTDLAISGNGFFVLTNQVGSNGQPDNIYFSRAGSFRLDNQNRFTDPGGKVLLAWPLDSSGDLPVTKSLTTSLTEVNVQALVSQASATTNASVAVNLNASQKVVSGGVATLNIQNRGNTASPYNFDIKSKEIIIPNAANSLTKGEGIQLVIDNVASQIEYGGFVQTQTITNASNALVGTSTDTVSIQVGTQTFQFTRGTGTTDILVLENLAKQINATTGAQALTARIINNGTTSSLYIAPLEANNGMRFTGTAGFTGALGLTSNNDTSQFVAAANSGGVVGRFASFANIESRLKALGIQTSLQDLPGGGAHMSIYSSKPTSLSNYQPKGAGSDFLGEFNLTSGFLQTAYNAYDATSNMASHTNANFNPQFSQNFTVYDSLGNAQNLLIGFLKTNANTWEVEIYANDPSVVTIPGRTDGLLQAGTVVFDGKGNLSNYINATQRVKASVSNIAPNASLGATAAQTLTLQTGLTTYTYNYGQNYASTSEFAPGGTSLVQNGTTLLSTDSIIVTIGGNAVPYTRGNGTTNLAVLQDLVNQINAGVGGTPANNLAKARLELNPSTGDYYVVLRGQDPTAAIDFSGATMGGTAFNVGLGVTASNNIAANSFQNLYELSDLMNASVGTDGITAEVVYNPTKSTYDFIIQPATATNTLSFGGSPATINAPLGTGLNQSIASALGLVNTSTTNAVSSLTDPITMNWSNTVGAIPNIITMNYGVIGTTDGFGQVSAANALKKISQNGVSTGNLSGISVDGLGVITASFSNGQTRKIYQLPIATFANPNGLNQSDGNLFQVSNNSGALNLQEASLNGAGSVIPQTIEGSNVDIADQLSKLIITQRQYQASSKVINIIDQLQEELLHRTFS